MGTHKPFTPRPGSAALIALVFASSVMVPLAATGQRSETDVLRGFADTGQYTLEVDGKRSDKGRVYLSQAAGAYLILDPGLTEAILVRPRQGVKTVPYLNMAQKADGSIDVHNASSLRRVGEFRVVDQAISFDFEGREIRLAQRPPLVGKKTLEDLLEHSPEYARAARGYNPNPSVLGSLREQDGDVAVRVFFGSWCHVCKTYLPNHLRVQQDLAGSKIRFEYYGLTSPPAAWQDPEVKRLEVKSLPTAIVYVNGKEKGRFIGSQGFTTPERSLMDALR